MSDTEKVDVLFEDNAQHAIITRLAEIDNEIYEQKRQRPFNIPYIKQLLHERAHLQINLLAIRDRLNKVDGCF